MFEFHYCVDLVIVHPSLDPTEITRQIEGLTPEIESRAGDERTDSHGNPLGRTASLSVWSAPLHESKRMHSASNPLSAFISAKLEALKPYADIFRQANEEGRTFLIRLYDFRLDHNVLTGNTLNVLAFVCDGQVTADRITS